jgi:hypothetical protein
VETYEYFSSHTAGSEGVLVLIQHYRDVPLMRQESFILSPGRVSIIRIFIGIFFLENYSLFEYFLTEYSNNKFLLNKPYKNVNIQTIFPKNY